MGIFPRANQKPTNTGANGKGSGAPARIIKNPTDRPGDPRSELAGGTADQLVALGQDTEVVEHLGFSHERHPLAHRAPRIPRPLRPEPLGQATPAVAKIHWVLPGGRWRPVWSQRSRFPRPIPGTDRPRGQIPMVRHCPSHGRCSASPPDPALAAPASRVDAGPSGRGSGTDTGGRRHTDGPAAAPAWRTIAWVPPPDPPIILAVPAIRLPMYVIRPGPLIWEAAAAACSVAAGTWRSAIGRANDPRNRNATAKNSVVMSPLTEP